MSVPYPHLKTGAWVRTCQECGHHQADKKPAGEPSLAYCNRECKKCKSEALDYGQENVEGYDEEA